ncbi:MAG: histidine phosphatase family protein [Lachnospiraceae bacterium]|nr:histidine phosphatase family protein [Lachnospiraceae bacterium]
MKIIFIRHGMTKLNEEKRYLGLLDEPLSEKGKADFGKKWCEKLDSDVIVTSPMLRCIQSAELIIKDMKTKKHIVVDEFREINFGIFEGKTFEELKDNPDYQKWIDSRCEMKIPEGESKAEFVKRTMKGFTKLLHNCNENNWNNVVCVVHGGTIMAILSEISGGDYYDFYVKNAEARELIVEDDKYEIPYYSICGRIHS